tara:strand:- start:13474 stop:13635 length:162 start_codon:yes stop_codon:yes gene_type:complete
MTIHRHPHSDNAVSVRLLIIMVSNAVFFSLVILVVLHAQVDCCLLVLAVLSKG